MTVEIPTLDGTMEVESRDCEISGLLWTKDPDYETLWTLTHERSMGALIVTEEAHMAALEVAISGLGIDWTATGDDIERVLAEPAQRITLAVYDVIQRAFQPPWYTQLGMRNSEEAQRLHQ